MGGSQASLRDLGAAISALYPQPLPDAEAEDAARNLAGFAALLLEIDREQRSATPKTGGRI